MEEDKPGEEAKKDPPDDVRDLVAPHPAVVDVQGDDGQGTCARHKADGNAVV